MKELIINPVTLKKNGVEKTLHGIVDKEDTWELIAEGTLSEASTLKINQDANGNPFKLKKCLLRFLTPDNSAIQSQYIGVSKSNDITGIGSVARIYQGGSNGSYRKTMWFKYDASDPILISSTIWANASSRQSNISIFAYDGINTGTQPTFIPEFGVPYCATVFTLVTLPAGTQWRLIGVKV